MIVIGLGVIFFGFAMAGSRLVLAISQSMAVSLRWLERVPDRSVYCGGVLPGRGLIGITAGEAKNPQVTLRSAEAKCCGVS